MLVLKDNTFNTVENLECFKKYSAKSINELIENNEDFVLLGKKQNNKNLYNNALWNISGEKVQTYNIMGFMALPFEDKTLNIKIASRFTQDSEKDYFLHYMLQKIFLGQIINLDTSASDEYIFDFYLYMFLTYFAKAMQAGIYKEYFLRKYNNLNVHGTIDIKRHIKHNTPFTGSIAYNTKEHSYDNNITQLIRHTIEYIKQKKYGHYLLSKLFELQENIKKIEQSTRQYNYTNREDIKARCRFSIKNPYYKDYESLRQLCLKILNFEKFSYGKNTKNSIHACLFDGAWLWEEYLNTLLCKKDFIHPDNTNRTKPIYLVKNDKFERYPDFYSKDKKIIIDAKYKKIDGENRDDIHQIISYMYILKSCYGILVYPTEENTGKIIDYELNGYGGNLIKQAFIIPKAEGSFKDFAQSMQKNEDKFIKEISNL